MKSLPGGFIKKHNRRIVHHLQCNGKAFPLSPRQFGRSCFPARHQAEIAENLDHYVVFRFLASCWFQLQVGGNLTSSVPRYTHTRAGSFLQPRSKKMRKRLFYIFLIAPERSASWNCRLSLFPSKQIICSAKDHLQRESRQSSSSVHNGLCCG